VQLLTKLHGKLGNLMPDSLWVTVGRHSIITVMINMELKNESSC